LCQSGAWAFGKLIAIYLLRSTVRLVGSAVYLAVNCSARVKQEQAASR
jgi:hypothetical protein